MRHTAPRWISVRVRAAPCGHVWPASHGGTRGRLRRRARHETELGSVNQPRARIVIIGGGPGGYEAALVAAQLGAEVTVVDRDGLGGACVLTDCVPSKTLIATSGLMAALEGSAGLGIRLDAAGPAQAGTARPGSVAAGSVAAGSMAAGSVAA